MTNTECYPKGSTCSNKVEIDISKATSTNFLLLVDKLPNFEYFITETQVPSISQSPVNITLPSVSPVGFPSTTNTYPELEITAQVDERFRYYNAVVRWMQHNITNEGNSRIFSDASLIIVSNAKQPIMRISFKDAFPTNVGSISMSTSNTETPTFTVTMQYHYFEIDYLIDAENFKI